MDDIAFLQVLRAARRSRIKVRCWSALAVGGVMLPAELAEAANTSAARVHGVMHGDGDRFSRHTSLLELGVARAIPTPEGPAYAITPAGRSLWAVLKPRVGFTTTQIEGRWPSGDQHLTLR